MKIGFAGTPEFARVALARLHAAAFDVAWVLTQPDRPAGRGLKLQPSPVKAFAVEHAIPVLQPRSLRLDGRHPGDAAGAREALQRANLDVLVVAAYGLILPRWTLESPHLGCLNIHASLLPRWRGAAPIHRAIEAGDAETGITIMQMDEGLDTGATWTAERVPIAPDDTTATLQTRLAALGGDLVVSVLQSLDRGPSAAGGPQPQPPNGATYAHKVEKAEAAVDWRLPADVLERRLRAFDPFPGATAVMHGETVKLWRARVVTGGESDAPGEVLRAAEGTIRVGCGLSSALEVLELQRVGGRRVSAREFLQRGDLSAGMRFEIPALEAGSAPSS